jgi:hypothetical protein
MCARCMTGMKMKPWLALMIALFALRGFAQSSPQGQSAPTDPNRALGAPVTVHGVVMNAASGEPLPRALVQVNGGGGAAVLTDGDGRFEVTGVALGPSIFQLTKPGFEDAASGGSGEVLRDLRGFTHNVFVTANTPELVFTMRPTNSIRGQIELSTGDPAQNNEVTLLQLQIQNGRAVWRPRGAARANSDGTYHFAHLEDGDYAIVAEPAPESELAGRPDAAAAGRDLAWNGFPQIYFPDARDFSGAARIHLSGGESAQANVNVPLEVFHAVRAGILLPPDLRNSAAGAMVQVEVTGLNGTHLPYSSMYDGESRTVWTMLPDGTYTLRVTAMQSEGPRSTFRQEWQRWGQADVTVAGHAVTKLRIPVGAMTPSSLQVMVSRTGTQSGSSAGGGNHGNVFVEIGQAGPLTDGMQSVFAQGPGPGTLETMPPAPGKYWVHTIVADPSLCEDSFTAGGANLGREPLVVGPGGTTAPLTLSLRDDCASLKVSLPQSVAGMAAGEEIGYYVYVVPDRDFTTEAPVRTLRASTNSEFTFTGLTPGSYHVYAFSAPVDLEYHNRDALAALNGQAITLAAGDSGSLVLEVPAQ